MDDEKKNLILIVNILRLPAFQDYIKSETAKEKIKKCKFVKKDLFYKSEYIDDVVDNNGNLIPIPLVKTNCDREKVAFKATEYEEGMSSDELFKYKKNYIKLVLLTHWCYTENQTKEFLLKKMLEKMKTCYRNVQMNYDDVFKKMRDCIEKEEPIEQIIDRFFSIDMLEMCGI